MLKTLKNSNPSEFTLGNKNLKLYDFNLRQ
jgi:hypothetical protein